jgi:RNA polymerase sigma-70 factor (ECF subfamily)
MPVEEELEVILAKCLEGSEAGFQKLYYRFYGFLFTIARRYARDNDEAQDIVQSGFIRIFKNLSQYKGDGSFKSWIKSIIINESINHFKRVNKGNTMQYQDDMSYFEYSESMMVSEKSILAKMSYDELYALVQELPSAYKTVFTLYVLDGYKHQEIAELLAITESTSKSNLSRAKVILIEKLNKVGISIKKTLIENV